MCDPELSLYYQKSKTNTIPPHKSSRINRFEWLTAVRRYGMRTEEKLLG
jgi:hypothetical protein